MITSVIRSPSERCPTCGRKSRRSNPANARWWVLMHTLADKLRPEGVGYSPETWHLYLASRFLGCDEIALPGGKIIQRPHKTSTLDVTEFNNLMGKAEAWAAEHNVWLEEFVE